jgi:hypothetical protein
VSVIIVVPSDLTSAAWAVVHLGSWFVWLLLLMLIYCKRKILLNGWLILTDKLKRTRPD